MARGDDTEGKKAKPRELVLTGISLASAFAVFNFTWGLRSDVEKIVQSQAHVLKPSRDEIRSVCSDLLDQERQRSDKEHTEMREAITWIMRYFSQGQKREAK